MPGGAPSPSSTVTWWPSLVRRDQFVVGVATRAVAFRAHHRRVARASAGHSLTNSLGGESKSPWARDPKVLDRAAGELRAEHGAVVRTVAADLAEAEQL